MEKSLIIILLVAGTSQCLGLCGATSQGQSCNRAKALLVQNKSTLEYDGARDRTDPVGRRLTRETVTLLEDKPEYNIYAGWLGGVVDRNDPNDIVGKELRTSFLIGVDYINSRPELYLPPPYRLVGIPRDSGNDADQGVEQAFYLARTCKECVSADLPANQQKVHAIFGDTQSGVTEAEALVSKVFDVLQIGYSTTAKSLGGRQYATFMRSIPDDLATASAVLELCQYFKWNRVGLLFTGDVFAREAAQLMREFFFRASISVISAVISTTENDIEKIKSALEGIQKENVRIFIVVTQIGSAADLVFPAAKDLGYTTEGYAWITLPTYYREDFLFSEALLEAAPIVVNPYNTVVRNGSQIWSEFLDLYRNRTSADFNSTVFASDSDNPIFFSSYLLDGLIAFARAVRQVIQEGQEEAEEFLGGRSEEELSGGEAAELAALRREMRTTLLDGSVMFSKTLTQVFDGVTGKVRFNETNGNRFGDVEILNRLPYMVSANDTQGDNANSALIENFAFRGRWVYPTESSEEMESTEPNSLEISALRNAPVSGRLVFAPQAEFVFAGGSKNVPTSTPEQDQQDESLAIILSATLGSSLLVAIVLVAYLHVRNSRMKDRSKALEATLRLDSLSLPRAGFLSSKDLAVGHHTLYHSPLGPVWLGRLRGAVVEITQLHSDIDVEDPAITDKIIEEAAVLYSLKHPNVSLFIGICLDPGSAALVKEHCPRGSLYDVLSNSKRISLARRVQMAVGIARGLHYLHHIDPPIVHGDLNSHNILVQESWETKIDHVRTKHFKHCIETYLTEKQLKAKQESSRWLSGGDFRPSSGSDQRNSLLSSTESKGEGKLSVWKMLSTSKGWDGGMLDAQQPGDTEVFEERPRRFSLDFARALGRKRRCDLGRAGGCERNSDYDSTNTNTEDSRNAQELSPSLNQGKLATPILTHVRDIEATVGGGRWDLDSRTGINQSFPLSGLEEGGQNEQNDQINQEEKIVQNEQMELNERIEQNDRNTQDTHDKLYRSYILTDDTRSAGETSESNMEEFTVACTSTGKLRQDDANCRNSRDNGDVGGQRDRTSGTRTIASRTTSIAAATKTTTTTAAIPTTKPTTTTATTTATMNPSNCTEDLKDRPDTLVPVSAPSNVPDGENLSVYSGNHFSTLIQTLNNFFGENTASNEANSVHAPRRRSTRERFVSDPLSWVNTHTASGTSSTNVTDKRRRKNKKGTTDRTAHEGIFNRAREIDVFFGSGEKAEKVHQGRLSDLDSQNNLDDNKNKLSGTGNSPSTARARHEELAGSCRWKAPESLIEEQLKHAGFRPSLVTAKIKSSTAVDVYGFGLVLSHILTGHVPYEDLEDEEEIRRIILEGEKPALTAIPTTCPTELFEIIERCVDDYVSSRPDIDWVLEQLESVALRHSLSGGLMGQGGRQRSTDRNTRKWERKKHTTANTDMDYSSLSVSSQGDLVGNKGSPRGHFIDSYIEDTERREKSPSHASRNGAMSLLGQSEDSADEHWGSSTLQNNWNDHGRRKYTPEATGRSDGEGVVTTVDADEDEGQINFTLLQTPRGESASRDFEA